PGDGRAGAKAPDDAQIMELSDAVDVAQHRREVERREDLGLCHRGEKEGGRQHANDRTGSSTDVDGLPDDGAVAPEDSAPGAEAEHDRRVDARRVLAHREGSPEIWAYAERREDVRVDARAGQANRVAGADVRAAAPGEGA